jgi:tetratricopeptide (TPR) repeat protein
MHKKLNVRLFLWTLVILTLLGVGAHFLHQSQVHANAGALRQEADLAVGKGDYARAAMFFNHYLAYEPEDADALVRYAAALEKLPPTPATRRQTVRVLEQALRLTPARHELRFRLVGLLIRQGQFAAAARHLESLTAIYPDRGDLEHKLGWCQEACKEYGLADASLRRAIRKAPAQLENYVLLAELLRSRLQRPEDATEVLDAMVTANPASPGALLARARYYRARGESERADEDTRAAAKLAPKDAEVLLATAEMLFGKGQAKEARDGLERGIELHPADGRLYLALAAVEVQAGRRAAAVAALRRGRKAVPTDREMAPLLADLLIDEGQIDEARALTEAVRKESGPAGVADYLDARLVMRAGRWAEACGRLEKVRGRHGLTAWLVQVELSLGQCYERLGETDQALAAYRRAVEQDGSVPLARLGLGAALLTTGNVEGALPELRRLAAGSAPAEVWPLLGRALLLHNLRLPENERDWADLRKVVERATKESPDSPEIPLLRAEALAARGRPVEGLLLLLKAQAERPKEIHLRVGLADLARRQGQTKLARETLERARHELGDSLELRLARLRDAAALPAPAARAALESLSREVPDALGHADRLRFERQLAEALGRAGDLGGAERLWRKLAAERPADLNVRLMLLDVALRAGREEASGKALAELRRVEGEDGVLWRAGAAARRLALAKRADRSALPEIRRLLAEAKERREDWARLSLLEAATDEFEGRLEEAAAHYARALELGEREPNAVARAARLLAQRGRLAEADQALRLLEEQGPLPRDLARLAADLALTHGGGAGRALALAEQAVSPDARDHRDSLWLARVQTTAGQSAAAEKTLRHAAKVAGRIPEVWVALVRHLRRTGQAQRAAEALQEAARRLPADRAALGLARCEEALGRPDRAAELYRKAAADRPGDFVALHALADFYRRNDEPAKAEPYLRKLIDRATRAPEEYVVRARRELAVDLAAAGAGARPVDEPLALLDRNARGRTAADDVARAFVLAMRPERRDEALRLLEEIPDRQALTPSEQFVLVRAYEAAGETRPAREALLHLHAQEGDNPQVLAYHVRVLLREGELAQAIQALDQLARVEPNSPRTQALRAALRKAGR